MKLHRLRFMLANSLLLLIAFIPFAPFAAQTAQAAEQNLVLNSSFAESDPTNPATPRYWHQGGWGENQATLSYPVPGFTDNYAIKADLTSYTSGDVKWFSDPIAITAGETYLFTDQYQATVPTIITLQYQLTTGELTYQDVKTLSASTGWTKAQATFTAPANVSSVIIFHLLNQIGSLTIDDPTLSINIVTPPTDPNNLIVNGTLETAAIDDGTRPDSWIKGNWGTNEPTFTYPVTGFSSAKAAQVSINNFVDGDAKWAFTPVAITTGTTPLIYTDYFQATIPTHIVIAYVMNDGSSQYQYLASLPASTTWTETEMTFSPPISANTVTVYHLLSSNGTLTIDQARLSATVTATNNLILNADLNQPSEDDPEIPTFWTQGNWGNNNTIFNYPVAGPNGTKALEVSLTSHNSGDAKWVFDAVAVTPGLIYRYSEDYKSTIPSEITARFDFSDGSKLYTDVKQLPAASDWTNMTATISPPTGTASMTIFHLIQQVGTLTTSGFHLPQSTSSSLFAEGMISLTFDDGFFNHYQVARPILNQANIKGSFYIMNDSLDGSNPDYMTTEQALAMQADGHEVSSHSKTHPFLSQLSPSQLHREIVEARLGLIDLGLSPVQTFVYPYGDYNDAVIEKVKEAGYIGARSVQPGFNDKLSDPYQLMDQHVESHTTFEEIQAWISQAQANKTWLILEIHEQDYSGDQYSNTPEFLQAVANHIQSSGIKTVTMSQGLQLMAE